MKIERSQRGPECANCVLAGSHIQTLAKGVDVRIGCSITIHCYEPNPKNYGLMMVSTRAGKCGEKSLEDDVTKPCPIYDEGSNRGMLEFLAAMFG